MDKRRGNPEDITEAYYRGLMHSVGYRSQDLAKPQIAVVNSFTEVNPGHQPLRELAGRVKEGIWVAGGAPAEFNVPAPCDGMAQGPGQRYVLPQRDLIAASMEAMVAAHGFEGWSCWPPATRSSRACSWPPPGWTSPRVFITAGAMLPCRQGDRARW